MGLLQELARVRTMLAAMAILVAAYVLVEGPARAQAAGTKDTATTLFQHAIPLIFLCWMAAVISMQIATCRRLDSFEYRDASAAPKAPPPKVASQGAALMSNGFRPFGEMEWRFPWQDWRHGWVFVDATGYVSATLGIGSSPPLSTGWSDGSFVMTVTSIPARVARTERGWVVSVSPGTPLQGKYQRHIAESQGFGAGRGVPLGAASMADYLATEPP